MSHHYMYTELNITLGNIIFFSEEFYICLWIKVALYAQLCTRNNCQQLAIYRDTWFQHEASVLEDDRDVYIYFSQSRYILFLILLVESVALLVSHQNEADFKFPFIFKCPLTYLVFFFFLHLQNLVFEECTCA